MTLDEAYKRYRESTDTHARRLPKMKDTFKAGWVAAQREACKWRTDEPPKDGTLFLIQLDTGDVTMAVYDRVNRFYDYVQFSILRSGEPFFVGALEEAYIKRWQPLPEV